jgi:hypothetical protein
MLFGHGDGGGPGITPCVYAYSRSAVIIAGWNGG